MTLETLHKISYGLYIISCKNGEKMNGQIANVVFQITAEPPAIAISISKNNYTHEYLTSNNCFSASILAQNTPMQFIGLFGFKSGKNVDKFQNTRYIMGAKETPIVTDFSLGYLVAETFKTVDVGTHTLFLAQVLDARITSSEEPLTYAYYHNVIKGKSPKNAPTYLKEEEKK